MAHCSVSCHPSLKSHLRRFDVSSRWRLSKNGRGFSQRVFLPSTFPSDHFRLALNFSTPHKPCAANVPLPTYGIRRRPSVCRKFPCCLPCGRSPVPRKLSRTRSGKRNHHATVLRRTVGIVCRSDFHDEVMQSADSDGTKNLREDVFSE